MTRASLLLSWLALVLSTSHVLADDTHAKTAYDEATRALDRGDYDTAARAFYRADLASPHDDALTAALVAVLRTDNALLAMRLAQRTNRSPFHKRLNELRAQAEKKFGRRVGRVVIQCEACTTITLDEVEVAHDATTIVLVGRHAIAMHLGGEAQRRTIDVTPGAETLVSPTATVAPPPATVVDAPPAPPALLSDEAPASAGVSPALFWTCLALTGVSAAGTVVSGVDLHAKHDAFAATPNEETAADGDDAQRRTQALVGVTAGLALVTILIGTLGTDWGTDDDVGFDGTTLRLRF